MLDEEVAAAVTKVLRGVFEKSNATAYGSGPRNGQPVAGKTGTGVDYRDHWLVGYCPTLTCATWIGNRDYSSTSPSLNTNRFFQDFMSMALEGTEIVDFPKVADPPYWNKLNSTVAGSDDDEKRQTNSDSSSSASAAADSGASESAAASAAASDAAAASSASAAAA